MKITCKECGEYKKHQAHGLCQSWQINIKMKRILILLLIIPLFLISCNNNDCSEQLEKVRQEMAENCDTRIIESQENCNQIIREREQTLRAETTEWKQKYEDCINQSDPPKPPKLTIRDGKLYYGNGGTERIILCGVSRWEALWRETGEHDSCGGWGEYSLSWYENELINSGINYVRHGGIKNTQFLYDHCKRMRDAGIIVEITVYRAGVGSQGILVNLADMGELAKLGNVFFDVNNEFLDEPNNINKVIEIAKNLKAQGCLVSAGAWSGSSGKAQSEIFHQRYNDYDIETHHREWNTASFRESMQYGKPVVWNEYFAMKAGLSLEQIKSLMRLAFDCGIQGVQYYGFRLENISGLEKYDSFDYSEILNYAGQLAFSFNQELIFIKYLVYNTVQYITTCIYIVFNYLQTAIFA